MAIPRLLTPEALTHGLFPATWVATPEGWRAAASLRPGHVVLTVGAGPMRLIAVDPQPPPLWVQLLPQGACGNRGPIRLPPGQTVLIETDAALPLTGEPYALIPAEALEGWRGIESQPNTARPIALRLETPVMIYAGPGLVIGIAGAQPLAPGLTLAEAKALIARLVAEDLGAGLCQAALRGA